MTIALRLLGAASVLIVLWAVLRLGLAVRAVRRRYTLDPETRPGRTFGGDAPLVSILVPARNEERGIEACLRSLLAQDYPRLEVRVWDDGSEDLTLDLARGLAALDPRLSVFHGDGPPPGWIGKCHALHRLAAEARGDWLLFADADTVHHRRSVSAGLGHALEHGLEALSCAGERIRGSFWERVWEPLWPCFLLLSLPPDRTNDAASPVHFGIGQWFLLSRRAHAAVGGHEAVRGEIVEDCALARRLRQLRIPYRVLFSTRLFRVRMYRSGGEIWEGWSKNSYRALRLFGRGPIGVVAAMAALGLATVAPFAIALAAAAGLAPGLGPVAAFGPLLLTLTVSLAVRARERSSPGLFWTLPLAGVFALGVLANSALRRVAGAGVAWKGRRYPGGLPRR